MPIFFTWYGGSQDQRTGIAVDCAAYGFSRLSTVDVISPLHSAWSKRVKAFHEKAGRSQGNSGFIVSFCSLS
jgi:hypothetical protein